MNLYIYSYYCSIWWQYLFGPDTVKLNRQATEIIEEEEPGSDNESISSESSSNRLNSIDSNLADEIMTTLRKQSGQVGYMLEPGYQAGPDS